MAKMTGAQALVKSIHREGVRVVFGLPGAGQYEAIDAIYEEPGMRYFTTRNEQATSYMADGYARISGEIAMVLVVPGAGLINASTGISIANTVSSPMLVVTGTHHDRIGDDSDEMAWIRPITKWAARINNPADIPEIVQEAFYNLKTGRRRPVELEISQQTLAAEVDIELIEPVNDEPPKGNLEHIEQAARILADSQHPAIWAGGGVHRSNASRELQTLAEHLQAPVVTSPSGKGAISDQHPLSLGLAELRFEPLKEWLEQRDVILAVGTSAGFGDRLNKQQVIRIDIDEGEIGRKDHHSFGIVADARQAVEGLYRIASTMTPARPSCTEEVNAINTKRFDPAIQLEPQHSLMKAIRAAMPDDGILVQGMNQMGYYSRNHYPVYAPRSYLTAAGNLGITLPLALGAKLAKPDKAVVVAAGDGGFLYHPQELATAAQYGINVVAIVFNDNAYGNVLRAQIKQFNGHILGTELHNPDFVKLAEAYGVRGVRAEGAEQLEAALRETLTIEAPTLIEVPVGMMDRQY